MNSTLEQPAAPAPARAQRLPLNPDTIEPYLNQAITTYNTSISPPKEPVSLFVSPLSHPPISPPPIDPPTLLANSRNNILLYPGSFNPPHMGHLATILYFAQHRAAFNIPALFIYADPASVIATRSSKAYNTHSLPQSLRYKMFSSVPALAKLMHEKWLFIITGDMSGHIKVLRSMTDNMVSSGWDTKLVCFLGGDKLSVSSAPHQPPGNLGQLEDYPIDEYLIMNARRPVDFFYPSLTDPDQIQKPRDLPGCTTWERGEDKEGNEREIGRLWTCRALTVKGKPVIGFRASKSSASNGVSSTKIRRVMTECEVGEVEEGLKDMVLSVFLLVEWLKKQRKELVEVGSEE